jgi:hypothetical protein
MGSTIKQGYFHYLMVDVLGVNIIPMVVTIKLKEYEEWSAVIIPFFDCKH